MIHKRESKGWLWKAFETMKINHEWKLDLWTIQKIDKSGEWECKISANEISGYKEEKL